MERSEGKNRPRSAERANAKALAAQTGLQVQFRDMEFAKSF
jgi:hypothetical protein